MKKVEEAHCLKLCCTQQSDLKQKRSQNYLTHELRAQYIWKTKYNYPSSSSTNALARKVTQKIKPVTVITIIFQAYKKEILKQQTELCCTCQGS